MKPNDTPAADPSAIVVRPTQPEDAAAVLAIYAPYVEETTISFETEVPSLDEMEARIAAFSASHAHLVAEQGGRILGYAYAGAFAKRAAYRFAAEVSVYVDREQRSAGVGRELYDVLLDQLRAMGCHSAVAIVTVPNPASVGFHERFGFRHVGTLREIGFKDGAWRDVAWLQLMLGGGDVAAAAIGVESASEPG